MFEQYSRQPRAFSGGVSLASLCPEKDFPGLSRFMNVLMINGDNEQGITADMLERQHREIAKYVGKFEGVVVPGDHFFLFSSEKEVITLIRNFIDGES